MMRFICALLASLIALPALANPVYEMCMRPGNHGKEQCDCAASALLTAFSLEERDLFGALAERYLDRRDEGLHMSDAWDAAVQSEAMARNTGYVSLLSRSNELGERWSDILERCSS